jgi:hypothetical protein
MIYRTRFKDARMSARYSHDNSKKAGGQEAGKHERGAEIDLAAKRAQYK